MPAVSKGDGMRGLAVFISDIRNCEWPRRRTRPAGGGGPAGAGAADLRGGSPGSQARDVGGGLGDAGLGAPTGVRVCGSGSRVRTWQWRHRCGVCGTAEGVPAKAPLPSVMSSRAISLFLVMEHLT